MFAYRRLGLCFARPAPWWLSASEAHRRSDRLVAEWLKLLDGINSEQVPLPCEEHSNQNHNILPFFQTNFNCLAGFSVFCVLLNMRSPFLPIEMSSIHPNPILPLVNEEGAAF